MQANPEEGFPKTRVDRNPMLTSSTHLPPFPYFEPGVSGLRDIIIFGLNQNKGNVVVIYFV